MRGYGYPDDDQTMTLEDIPSRRGVLPLLELDQTRRRVEQEQQRKRQRDEERPQHWSTGHFQRGGAIRSTRSERTIEWIPPGYGITPGGDMEEGAGEVSADMVQQSDGSGSGGFDDDRSDDERGGGGGGGDEDWEDYPLETAEKRMRSSASSAGTERPASECFGCVYYMMSTPDGSTPVYAAIGNKQVQHLHGLMSNLINGGISADVAAFQVSAYYERMRQKVNSRRTPEELELPPWNPATVLAHWNRHLKDPNILWTTLMEETTTMRMEIAKSMMRRHKTRREIRFVKDGVRDYERVFNMQLRLIGKMPANANIPEVMSRVDMSATIKMKNRRIYQAYRSIATTGRM